jgi:hypothetical protein
MHPDDITIQTMRINPEGLKVTKSTNTRQVTQYFDSHNVHTNLNKTNCIMFKTKLSRYETNLKVFIKIQRLVI